MPDPKKVRIGAPFVQFPGASFNALVDGELQRKSSKPPDQSPTQGSLPYLRVVCHNSTSTTIEPGEILGFSAPMFTVEDDDKQVYSAPNVKGITPAVPEHSAQFVVALDYIRGSSDVTGGGAGPAVLQGLTWVKVNWTDEDHTKCKVVEGETMLQSSSSGIAPVWHEEIPEAEYLPAELWALIIIGGGAGVSNATTFAVVIESAAANLGTPGKCILLDENFAPVDESGTPFTFDVTDPDDDYYDEYAVDAAAVWFYSAHSYAPCPIGVRVWLSATIEIVPGADDDTEHKIKGLMTDPADYYQTFIGAGANKGLTGAATAAGQTWTGVECPEET